MALSRQASQALAAVTKINMLREPRADDWMRLATQLILELDEAANEQALKIAHETLERNFPLLPLRRRMRDLCQAGHGQVWLIMRQGSVAAVFNDGSSASIWRSLAEDRDELQIEKFPILPPFGEAP